MGQESSLHSPRTQSHFLVSVFHSLQDGRATGVASKIHPTTAPLIHVGGETIRVLRHMNRLVVTTNWVFTTLHGGDEQADGWPYCIKAHSTILGAGIFAWDVSNLETHSNLPRRSKFIIPIFWNKRLES